MVVCYHCDSKTDLSHSYHSNLSGVERQFCCAGCMAISQTIHNEGLGIFYARRVDPGDKPASYLISDQIPEHLLPYDDPSLIHRFTRPEGKTGKLETTIRLEKIRCAACVWLCEQHLLQIVGVEEVQINYVTQKAKIIYFPKSTSLARLIYEIERIGYAAWPFEPQLSIERSKKEKRNLLTRLGVALLAMMQVMMYAWPSYISGSDITAEYDLLMRWASWVLTVPVIVYSAGPIFQSAWRSLRIFPRVHLLGMDVPIALALALSFLAGTFNLVTGLGQSYFDSITMFVAFILAARFIELLARQDAQSGAEALAKQLPATCEKVINYEISEEIYSVPVVNCYPGDILRVSPGRVLPADGILLKYESIVDESLLTGESKPVHKVLGDQLFAGTYNILNPILMKIEAVGQSTRIAGIASLLDQALLAKPLMVSLAEKWAGYFVGFLLICAFLSSGIWLYIDPSKAWSVLVAVLVASCPCALSLAIPTAMAAAQGTVTKFGLLIVRSHVLEGLVKTTDLILDKTGTITIGYPELKEIRNLRVDYPREAALALAAALESGQQHPLALSILRLATEEQLILPKLNAEVKNQMGRGLTCGTYQLGSATWLGINQTSEDAQASQYGQAHLRDEKGLIASFIFLDSPREGLNELLQVVKDRNIQVHLISGDDPKTVSWWANQVGIQHFRAGCTPEDKYEYVQNLQSQGHFIWAIGDGVNDAPLLARANVSVAIGAGAPLASAGADAILTSASLESLAKALIIADKTKKIIQQNLSWALAYNLIAIPVAMFGLVNPWLAGIGMSCSSLIVTINAWRLRKI